MTDHAEPEEWPECELPDLPSCCIGCGEPFADAASFARALSSRPLCVPCARVDDQLEAARYDHDVNWPGNVALAALDLDEDGQHRAAGLFVAWDLIDPQDSPADTLRALLTEGAKPLPPEPQVRHDWLPGDQRKTCARCGEIRWELRGSRDW